MKTKTIITIFFSVVFFIAMTVLTLSARAVHNASLPEVTAKRLSYERFVSEQTGADGSAVTVIRSAPAIETFRLESDVYVIYKAEKNGESRNFARLAKLETGEEYSGFTEIVSGINSGDKFISEYSGELYDGCEVFIPSDS